MSLIDSARAVLGHAADVFDGTPKEPAVRAAIDRLDGPLRVAIAGRVKAGKSTLLNALVGEQLAPTDAGECTRVVTWYQDGLTYGVRVHPVDGEPSHARFSRDDGAIDVDLGERHATEIDRIVIDWPSASLREMTLIDTPGIASLSQDISERTHSFLAPDDEQPTEADAVLYLLRHLHASDVRFLEAFHDDEVAQATPINAIGVLSRADEIGVGRLDSLESASRIAGRLRQDPQLRRLCQTVIPVAGLLGQGGTSLTEDEFRALAKLVQLPDKERGALLMSVDRFVAENASIDVLLPAERAHLLSRFGLFGIRLSIEAIGDGSAPTAGELAAKLRSASGIDQLRDTLFSQFAGRRDVLKARSALLTLDALLIDESSDAAALLASDVEEIQARAHEFSEMRLLNLIRTQATGLRTADIPEAERLLGAEGSGICQRLGFQESTPDHELKDSLNSAIGKWKRRAEHPLADRAQVDAATVIVRSCEGMLAELFDRSTS